jgi:TolB-like protein
MKIMAGGLTEALLNHLMEIENLVIRSKTSVEQYRETTKPLKEIAKEMKVDYVIETSGWQYGDNLQFQINLADAENDNYLLREPYTANMKEENFLDLQNLIVFDIIEKTKTQLSPREIELLEERMTDNKAALRFYLMGLQHLALKHQKESLSNWDDELAETFHAKKMFEKAIQLDSGFTAAYVNLGSILIDNLYYRFDRPLSHAYLDSGLVLAEKAISLYNKREKDRNYRWALGLKSNYFYFKGNLEKARYYADEAGKLGPFDFRFYFARTFKYNLFEDNYQSIYCFLKYLELKPETEIIMPNILRSAINCYSKTGFPEIAEKYLLELLESNNDSLHFFSAMSDVSMWNGNFNSSISYDRKLLLLDSSWVYPLSRMAWCYVNLKDYTSAAECVKTLEKSKFVDLFALTIAFVHLKTGNQQKALEFFEIEIKNRLEQIDTRTLAATQYKSHYLLACTYSAMGEKEKALHYLKEVNNRITMPLMLVQILKEGPMFDNIRTEPEFIKLKKEFEAKYQKEHKRIAALLRQKGEI